MVDTTSITSLIKAFRAETSKDSINPERLGSLLQKIADTLATAASISDIGASTELVARLNKVGQVLTALSVGSDDTKKIKLSYNTVSIQTGETASFPDAISIPSANSNKAGAMTAAHVRKLNELATNLTSLTQSFASLGQALANETGERTGAMSNFGQQLANEQSARKTEDVNLSSRINTEESTRKTEDNNLSNRINAEASARVTADTAQSNRINALETSYRNLNTAISTLQNKDKSIGSDIVSLERSIDDVNHSVFDAKNDIDNLRNQIKTTKENLANHEQDDYTHIETVARNGTITVPGAAGLVGRGLIPLIFRCTISQSRRTPDENGRREYMDKKHGWHVHYGEDKIKFKNETMMIRDDRKDSSTKDEYFTDASTLFHFPKKHIVGYGKRTYDLNKGHRFKFAVAFAKAPDFKGNFNFSCLRTNLATFRVFAVTRTDEHGNEVDEFHFSI